MDDQDFYAELGVPRAATRDAIKRASRKLTRKYRPDVASGAGASERFKAAVAAYDVLRGPEKHKLFDQHGVAWGRRRQPDPRHDWNGGYDFRREDGADTDPTAFRNCLKSASQQCGRLGAQQAQITFDLAYVMAGADKALSLHVPQLDHQGHVTLVGKRLKIHIPKVAMPSQHLVLKGKGGDLILETNVRPHPTYRIDGSDLIADKPVTAREAVLGASLGLPIPDRRARLRVPAHARAGQKLRLKGRGGSGRRPVDLKAAQIIINPPKKIKEGGALFEQMAREMPFDSRSEMKG